MIYTVNRGDNLSHISKKFGVSLDELIQENNIKNPNLIRVGQQLLIPITVNTKSDSQKSNVSPSLSTLIPITAPITTDPLEYSYYTVKPGDTLSAILLKTGNDSSILDIVNLNKLSSANLIRVGQTLKVPITTYKLRSRSFDEIKLLEDEYNKKSNIDIINEWHKRNRTGEYYIIDDKSKNITSIYKDGTLVKSFPSIHGKNVNGGTWKRKHVNPDGSISYTEEYAGADDMTITYTNNGKILNLAGNLTTPAGIFFSSPTLNYHGSPAWIRLTKLMVDSGEKSGIASSIHQRTITENANTNGCTGLSKDSLKEMKSILGDTTLIKTYVLPVDSNNRFYIRNNLIQFENTNSNLNVSQYKTLAYSPILKIKYNTTNLDSHQKEVLKTFAQSLISNKKLLINDLKINNDTYNLLSILALGILGAESNYGQQHSAASNFLHAVGKFINVNNSSPDIYAKFDTYGGDKDNNSIGLTLIRFSLLSEDTKKLFEKYGIDKLTLVHDPDKAAMATIIKLADEYKRQGRSVEKAVKSWNNSSNYYDRILSNIKKREFKGYAQYKIGGKLNYLNYLEQGSEIHIKESHKGKFTEYCGGKVTEECILKGKNSPAASVRKLATFAANARKWKK